MTMTRVIGKTAAWVAATVAVLLVAAGTFVYTFDWNRLKPTINAKASAALGRPFEIRGDISLGWRHPDGETGWRAWVPWPTFTATDLVVGNPSWAKAPNFATLGAVRFDVEVLPLLAHTVVIPSIDVVDPAIDLERTADGRDNWTFAPQSSGPSVWHVQLHRFGFAKGTVAYRDAIQQADLDVAVDTLGRPIPLGAVLRQQEQTSRAASAQRVGARGAAQLEANANAKVGAASGASVASAAAPGAAASAAASGAPAASSATASSGDEARTTQTASTASGSSAASAQAASTPVYAFGFTVKGRYKGMPIDGTGKLGGVLRLRDSSEPFPLQIDVKAGDTRIALVGTLTDPMHLAALDLRLWLQGQSMAHLYTLTGVTLPETPPFATDGHLVGQLHPHASTFRYENFDGRVGGSDLHGTLEYDERSPRPLLTGQLVSNLLQFSDLAPIVGADSSASKRARGDAVKQPAGRVLPVETFRTDRWRALDADVTLTGRRLVKSADLPVTDLYTHLVMTDGVLTLEPLRFGVAGGTLSTTARLDGSGTPLKGRFTLQARHLKLKQLFPTQQVMQSALGEINGDATLSAIGNSPAALAATSNGEVKALVNDGEISRLLMEAAGLNVANVVYEKLFGSQNVKINCAAADFVATDGILNTKLFAVDTDDAVIVVNGTVNLRDESLDMSVHPHTRGFRVFSLRSPLYVKGTFAKPDVGVEAGALALRAGAIVGLGLLNPFAALIPLIAPSHGTDVPCSQMFAQLKSLPPPSHGPHAVHR